MSMIRITANLIEKTYKKTGNGIFKFRMKKSHIQLTLHSEGEGHLVLDKTVSTFDSVPSANYYYSFLDKSK